VNSAWSRIALDALRQAGARVDRRCGLHVHFGAADLSAADIATVVRRYAKFEEQIDGWIAPSRRGDANHFCHSVRSFLQSGGTAKVRLESDTVTEVCSAFGTRYMKVNLEAWERHRTIEFRHHGGTVEAEKALPWILFCLGFVEQSRKVAQTTNTAALVPADTKIGTLVAMLSRMGGASIDDLVTATGWQRHTIRGAISSQLRKRGLQVITRRQNGTTVYALINRTVDADDHVFAGIDERTVSYLRGRIVHFARYLPMPGRARTRAAPGCRIIRCRDRWHPAERDAVFLEERDHPVIQQIGGGDRRL
jgi:Putative amidoligase enzyme/Protein of unknown function (DUF3489)